MKLVVSIAVVITALVAYSMWHSGEAKREIKLQRAAMTAAKSFHTSVTTTKGIYYSGYEGDAVCPDKLHFIMHANGSGVIADGTEYIKFGSVGYVKPPTGDWQFANLMSYMPDPCLNAMNDPTGNSAKSDAMEDTAEGSKGAWRTVNAESCMQWNFSVAMPGKNMEYEESNGADHLPREFKTLDGTYTAYYSQFGVPFVIEKPEVHIVTPNYSPYAPNYKKYEPPPPPKPSPDPEIPN